MQGDYLDFLVWYRNQSIEMRNCVDSSTMVRKYLEHINKNICIYRNDAGYCIYDIEVPPFICKGRDNKCEGFKIKKQNLCKKK
jgi:hypothetical protein